VANATSQIKLTGVARDAGLTVAPGSPRSELPHLYLI
jgi:hypothetical protein